MWSYQRVSYTDMHIHTWSYMSIHWCHSFMNTRNRCIGPISVGVAGGPCTKHQLLSSLRANPFYPPLRCLGLGAALSHHTITGWWTDDPTKPTSVDVSSNPSLKDRLHSVQSSLFGGDMSFFTKERTMVFIKIPGFTSISPWFSHHFTWIWRSQSTKLSKKKAGCCDPETSKISDFSVNHLQPIQKYPEMVKHFGFFW